MDIKKEFESKKAELLALLDKKKNGSITEEETKTFSALKNRLKEIEEAVKEQNEIDALQLNETQSETQKEIEEAVVNFSKNNKQGDKMEKDVKENKDNDVLGEIKEFGRGVKKNFALTSGTNSGVLMPKSITVSAVKTAKNAFRKGFLALGVNTFTTSSTENAGNVFLNDSSNVANNDQEGASSGASADASTANGSLDLKEYHSKATWYSKKLTGAVDFDVTQYVIPLHQNRIERQEEADWAALLIADSAIVGKTAASATAITYAETVDFDESVGIGYEDVPSFVLVSKTFKALLRKLVDSTGQPILVKNNEGLDTLFGKPVFTCANLEAVATGKVVAAIVPVESVIIRDTTASEFMTYDGESGHPGQRGYEIIGYSAFAYSTAAIRTFKMG